jgi:hypothetical protein
VPWMQANTDECIARGGFGSPTCFVNGTHMCVGAVSVCVCAYVSVCMCEYECPHVLGAQCVRARVCLCRCRLSFFALVCSHALLCVRLRVRVRVCLSAAAFTAGTIG